MIYTYSMDESGPYVTFEENTAYNAGTYYVRATITDTTNYVGKQMAGKLVINRIRWTDADHDFDYLYLVGGSRAYNGQEQYVGVSVAVNQANPVLLTNLSYQVTAEDALYQGSEGGNINVPVTYLFNTQGEGYEYERFTSALNAGTYYIKAVIEENINYEGLELTTTYTINPLVFANDPEGNVDYNAGYLGELYLTGDVRPYDGAAHYMSVQDTPGYLDKAPQTLVYVLDGGYELRLNVTYKFSYDRNSNDYTMDFTSATDAGVYHVCASLPDDVNGNYIGFTKDAVLEITKLDWTGTEGNLPEIFMMGGSTPYDMLTHYASVSTTAGRWNDTAPSTLHFAFKEGGVQQVGAGEGALSIDVIYTYATERDGEYSQAFTGLQSVGTVWVKAYIGSSLNYHEKVFEPVELSVTALVFANDPEGHINVSEGYLGALTFEGATLVYDGEPHSIAVVHDHLNAQNELVFTLAGGTLTIPLVYTASRNGGEYLPFDEETNAGEYRVRFSIAAGANGSYAATTGEAVLWIKPFETTIIWNKAFDTTTVYNGYEQVVTATIEMVDGVHDMGLLFLSRAELLELVGYDYEAIQAASTVLTNSTSIVYVNGEGTHTVDISAVNKDGVLFHAGEYVMVALFDNSNYLVTNYSSLVQELTIEKAIIDVRVNGKTLTYDGLPHYIDTHIGSTEYIDVKPANHIIELEGNDEATISYMYGTDGESYGSEFEPTAKAGHGRGAPRSVHLGRLRALG